MQAHELVRHLMRAPTPRTTFFPAGPAGGSRRPNPEAPLSSLAGSRIFGVLVAILWIAAVSGACLPNTRAPGDPRRRAASTTLASAYEQHAYHPKAPPARQYGVSAEIELDALEAAAIDDLSGKGRQHVPSLSHVARDLARLIPNAVTLPAGLAPELMAWHGWIGPPPQLFVIELPSTLDCRGRSCAQLVAPLIADIKSKLEHGPVHLGVGRGQPESGKDRLVIVLAHAVVEISPLAVHWPLDGSSRSIKGRLLGGRSQARIESTDPRGAWHRHRVSQQGRKFRAQLDCAQGPGRYLFEVLADGEYGPEVVANIPIYCGIDHPQAIAYGIERLPNKIDAGDLEQFTLELINDVRQRRGLAALEWHPAAAKIARAHSRDMAAQAFVGHTSPSSGDVADRFAQARVETTLLRENVAKGYGPRGMHEGLMDSPGHRVNILAEDITHVGIGIVVAPPGPDETNPSLYMTQNFLSPPERIDPKAAAQALRREIAREHAPPNHALFDDALSEIATRHARARARGRSGLSETEISEQVYALGFRRVQRLEAQANQWSAFTHLEVWQSLSTGDPPPSVGLALQSKSTPSGTSYMLVAILAYR